ncbi:MAG: prenyltransferase [Bacteroidales bacterium]|jgi:1,4-dihydroxy-2-naphthoate octaprenyltransferase|nr:prenyltransferase [Bacteroidales bacterium]
MKHSLKEWIFATRPWSLTASSMPALVAISYIFFIRNNLTVPVHWLHGVIALFGAVIFQVGGNLLNDYFDYKFKVDRKDTYSSRILVDEQFTPQSIYNFGVIALLVGSVIGIYLLIRSGWHLLWIGIAGFLGAYFYNRLKNIALGDLNISIIYGLLIGLGIGYVMTGMLMWKMLLITTPAGFLIVAILHANNTRDIVNDGKAHIKTQAMMFGVQASKIYFAILILASYTAIVCFVIFNILHPLALIVLLSLPMAIQCLKKIFSITINSLDLIMTLAVSVANLVMIFCLLYVVANFTAGII